MKITTVETFVVRIPFDDGMPTLSAGLSHSAKGQHPALPAGHPGDMTTEYPPVWRTKAVYTDTIEAVIVRIETDNGLVGWGEMHTPVAGEVSKAATDFLLAPLLIGRDPRMIAPLWEEMYASMRVRGHFNGFLFEAISGVDIALWDILGKSVGAPVSKLMGGQIRDRVPLYASCLPSVPVSAGAGGIDAVASAAQSLVQQGYKAFKVKLGVRLDIDRALLRRLREVVGDSIGIAVYANGAYDFAMARQAGKMMQDFNVLWLEDPLNPENRRDYARLTRYLDVPVAGGGSLCGRWAFNDYLVDGAFDLIQPDVSRAGGISESRKIAMLTDTYGLPFAPHVSRGTAIYMAASVQWAAASLNLMTCEWPMDQTAAGNGILTKPFILNDGMVQVGDAPGLGIELDEAALRQWAVQPA
jgi:D-arabinonate dehydratase/D-galactarolactone cycloisomerase